MNKTIRQSSFELEETIPGSFLVQGAGAGVVAGFLFVLFVMLWKPNPYNFLLILYVPFVMAFGIAVCAVKGTIIWALAKFFALRMRMATRVAMGFVGASLVGVLLGALGGSTDWRNLGPWIFISLLTAVPTGVLVGSRIRPWRIFTFGTVAVREGNVVCRQSSNSTLALLGSLPLRLASVVALTVWILTLAYLWPERGAESLRVALIALPPTFYLAASGYLSFRSPRKGTLLVVGILINAPLVILAILCYGQQGGGYVGDLPKVLEIFSSGFLLLWLIFLIARIAAPTAGRTLIASAVNQRVVTEDRSQHLCLGSRFVNWQTNFNGTN